MMEYLTTFATAFVGFVVGFAAIAALIWLIEKVFNAIGGDYGTRIGTIAVLGVMATVGAAFLTLLKFIFVTAGGS